MVMLIGEYIRFNPNSFANNFFNINRPAAISGITYSTITVAGLVWSFIQEETIGSVSN
jgi:hypothetical protein